MSGTRVREDVEAALSRILDEHGRDVFETRDRLANLLADYAPGLVAERRLVRTAADAGAYRALVAGGASSCQKVVERYSRILEDSYYVQPAWARRAVLWGVHALYPDVQVPEAPAQEEAAFTGSSVPPKGTARPGTSSQTGGSATGPSGQGKAASPPADPHVLYLAGRALQEGLPPHAPGEDSAIPRDAQDAVRMYIQAARMGHPAAQYSLACCLRAGDGTAADPARAAQLFQESATHGNANAQWSLGRMYALGDGVRQSAAESASWYRRAADLGLPMAQFSLGWCCETGFGVPRDTRQAFDLYTRAAQGGDPRAQCNLGSLCERGEGAPRNHAQAIRWYEAAAGQGLPKALYNLGWCHEHGVGVAADHTRAVDLYTQAAELGDADAQYHLGLCHEYGVGFMKSGRTARSWYERAAQQGHPQARKRAESMDSGFLGRLVGSLGGLGAHRRDRGESSVPDL